MMHSKHSVRAVSVLVLLPSVLMGQRAQEKVVPLQNWSTPLYWQRSPAETGAHSSAAAAKPALTPPAAVSNEPLTFIAMTPCRLADTRTGSGYLGLGGYGPVLPNVPRSLSVPLVTPTCGIPAGGLAQAYSFNVTVVNTFSNSGYLTVYPGPTQPTAAIIVWQTNIPYLSNAAIVAANPVDSSVLVAGGGNSQGVDVVIDINGYFAALSDLSGNSAIGAGALASNTTGQGNTASGGLALNANSTGNFNTANGLSALNANTTGTENTASGLGALQYNTTGNYNTASGVNALFLNTTGSYNTAIGVAALASLTIGNSNIAIGADAASSVSSGNSNHNIHIGSEGAPSDNFTIRIGGSGGNASGGYPAQTSFFVAGVRGITTGNSDAVPVVIDSNGQLGTVNSSRRFKEDIQDMGEASSGLMRLRPVTFRYKQAYGDGSKPMDYGLIAEEVAQVYPSLAVKGADGQIETVQYQKLAPMLLNELQKQHQEMEEQRETIRLQKERIAQQEEENQRVEARLAALETLLSGKPSSSAAHDQ